MVCTLSHQTTVTCCTSRGGGIPSLLARAKQQRKERGPCKRRHERTWHAVASLRSCVARMNRPLPHGEASRRSVRSRGPAACVIAPVPRNPAKCASLFGGRYHIISQDPGLHTSLADGRQHATSAIAGVARGAWYTARTKPPHDLRRSPSAHSVNGRGQRACSVPTDRLSSGQHACLGPLHRILHVLTTYTPRNLLVWHPGRSDLTA
jgi:hypothetical protein